MISGGIFDVAQKQSSLEDINNRLSDESTWSNLELSQSLNKEKADLEKDDIDLFIFDEAKCSTFFGTAQFGSPASAPIFWSHRDAFLDYWERARRRRGVGETHVNFLGAPGVRVDY